MLVSQRFKTLEFQITLFIRMVNFKFIVIIFMMKKLHFFGSFSNFGIL